MAAGPKSHHPLGRAHELEVGAVAVDLSDSVRASLTAYLDNEILKAAGSRRYVSRGDPAEIRLEVLQEIRNQLLGTRLAL